MPSTPIINPAGYAPTVAIGFADITNSLAAVGTTNPLPIVQQPLNASAALAGSTAATGILGPFVPVLDRPVMLLLSGTWTGSVRVLRSTDAGVTKLPLTLGGLGWAQFTGNCCEPVWDESSVNALLYLEITYASGTIAYRMEQ